MNSKIEGRLDNSLTQIAQEKLDQVMFEAGLAEMGLPKDFIKALGVVGQIMYQEGAQDTHDSMKDMYHNDFDEFESLFEDEDSLVL